MNKIFATLGFCLLLTGITGIDIPKTLAVDSHLDQSCQIPSPNAYFTVREVFLSQSFTPTVDRITRVDAMMSGAYGSLTFGLSKNRGSYSGDMTSQTISFSDGNPRLYSISFDPITVVPGQTYYVFATGGNASTSWAHPLSVWDDCYAGGTAYVNGVYDQQAGPSDFEFRVYGYNSADENQSGNTSQTGTTTGTSSSTSGSNQTNSSIKAPTGLKVEFQADTKSVKISWTKSETADITGYNILRSETQGKDYAKIGTVTQDKLEYSDNTVAAGKTYYYVIRSVKGNSQSANSKEVSIAIAADGATAATTAKKSSPVDSTPIPIDTGQIPLLAWVLAGTAVILDGVLAFLIYRRHKLINKGIK